MNNKIFGIVYCSYVQGNMFSACNRSLCGHQEPRSVVVLTVCMNKRQSRV